MNDDENVEHAARMQRRKKGRIIYVGTGSDIYISNSQPPSQSFARRVVRLSCFEEGHRNIFYCLEDTNLVWYNIQHV